MDRVSGDDRSQKVDMTRPDRYRVLLIRSGATDWDEQEYLPGVADLPLCAEERMRFTVDPSFVGGVRLSAVISAGDEASTETASLVARAYGAKTKKCTGLGDVDLGLWQGLRMDELRERAPKVYKQWIDDPMSLAPPEGESLRAARDRLVDHIIRLAEKAGRAGKGSVPAIAVVLRPIALSLVRSRFLDDPAIAGWCRLQNGPSQEWHEIPSLRAESFRGVTAATA